MTATTLIKHLHDDITMIQQAEPVPGKGFLPVLSYLIRTTQPVLIDTGTVRGKEGFVAALESVMDPADLAWIILTHPDTDHSGALADLLERAPKARLVLNWISTGKLSSVIEPPMPRVTWVNHDESLVVGERVLHFLRPPMYDCPSTVAVFDSKTRSLFSSDAFGAFVPELTTLLAEQPAGPALEGMSAFCRANSPWIAETRPDRYAAALKALAATEPSWLLSGHLPAVSSKETAQVFARAARLPEEGRVPAPTHQVLEAMLASMARAA
jgi:flavorubredoxin